MFNRFPKPVIQLSTLFLLVLAAASLTADFLPRGSLATTLWEYPLEGYSEADYRAGVETLFQAYEGESGRQLAPGDKGRAALKIYTASGPGLATPRHLVRAVIAALEQRGFARGDLIILAHGEQNLRESRYLSKLGRSDNFEGVPVYAHSTGTLYDVDWHYESNLPSRDRLIRVQTDTRMEFEGDPEERRSYLPAVLINDVDFWINLPVVADNRALGISGALANATLWNVSNNARFFDSPANAPVAAAEIAAIPELRRTLAFSLLTLERYQFMGGPRFNAHYTHREPRLWLSANPVAMDYLMWRRIQAAREAYNLPTDDEDPPLFAYARALGLGEYQLDALNLIRLQARRKE